MPGEAWSQGLLGVDLAVRDTLKRGFTAAEVGEFRKRYQEYTRHQIQLLPVMEPAELCANLADSITEQSVFVGPATELAWTGEWLAALKTDHLNRAGLTEFFDRHLKGLLKGDSPPPA